MEIEYLAVDLEPGEAAPDGLSLRFRVIAGETPRAVRRLRYESEAGTAGTWEARAVGEDGVVQGDARAVRVADSSEGTSLLVVGGAQGLLLEHAPSGERERVPYLLLAADTPVE